MDPNKFQPAFLKRIGTSCEEHKSISLDSNEITIGRAKENKYVIADLLISRKHAILRFMEDHWTIESVGMNGVALNHVILPKNQRMSLQHMDTVEFGAGSKFMFAFRMQSHETSDEPVPKKMRIPLGNRNYPSFKDSPEAFNNWIRSKKTLERTLAEESEILDAKLEEQNTLKHKLIQEQEKHNQDLENFKRELEHKFNQQKRELEEKVTRGELEKNELQLEKELLEKRMGQSMQEFEIEFARKSKEFEENVTRATLEKQALIEQKELVVQQLTREKNILQERLEEESRLREETVNELDRVKQSHQCLEKELGETRRKIEEEIKKYQLKGSEDESLLQKMREELDERQALLEAKEKELCEIQSRAAIGLDMYQAIQILQHDEASEDGEEIMIVVDEDHTANRPSVTELELQKVREELRIQKEINQQQLENASSQARMVIVDQMESIMENELQCGICSELMVLATSLNCMHTFCQYCLNQWKKNKVECPICRTPITTEGRNLLVDNMIDAMLNSLSEEMQNRRKELVKQRLEYAKLQATEKQMKAHNQGREGEAVPNMNRSTVSRGPGRPRRPAGRPGVAPQPTRPLTVPQSNTESVQARPRASLVRQPSRQLQEPAPTARPAAPRNAPQTSSSRRSVFAGPANIVSAAEEVVILSSESESNDETSEARAALEILEFMGSNTYRHRRGRKRTCHACGRAVRSSTCTNCNTIA